MASIFEEKKYKMEVLESLDNRLLEMVDEIHHDWVVTGQEQAKDWSTGELLWEDKEKTIPKYRDKYERVTLEDNQLSDNAKMRIDVINKVRLELVDLI